MGKGFKNATRSITDAIGLTQQRAARIDSALGGAAGQVQSQVAQTAMGQGPMLSQMQYNQALQDAASMGMSAAASARGVNPALAFRSAQMATQEAQANAAQQAAILNEEERRRAQELILGQYSQQRAQNIESQQAGQRNLIGALSGMGQAALSGGKK
jgi:hypothetical protein